MEMDADQKTIHTLSWEQLQTHLTDDANPEWIDIRDISDEGFSQLSAILKIPEPQFKSSLLDEIYPHIEHAEDISFIFVQSGKVIYPKNTASYLTIARSGIIVIYSHNKILTVSKHSVDLIKKVLAVLPKTKLEGSFVATMLYGILMSILTDYKNLLSETEIEVLKIGGLSKPKLPKDFLERMYRFQKKSAA